MTKKNARKTAARARQARLGGSYASHHRHFGGGSREEVEPTPRVLDEPAYPDEDFEEYLLNEDPVVVEMCRWFFRRFEDPVHGVPHDSGEGGYQYVMGGPHNAWDELGNEFPHVAQKHLDRAVELIQNHGWEWVQIGLY